MDQYFCCYTLLPPMVAMSNIGTMGAHFSLLPPVVLYQTANVAVFDDIVLHEEEAIEKYRGWGVWAIFSFESLSPKVKFW